MGVSRKSHGKKSDKETQSPVLKIFKDIMQREKTDPEKVNLLKDKKKERKRNIHNVSRLKPDQRSYDSSSTDRYRANEHTKITVPDVAGDKNGSYYHDGAKSEVNAFRGEKRESWWFWGGSQNQKKQKRTEDTCSCVSCALKKIVGSEYTCVACLFILFSISVAIIFLTVFKTMTATEPEPVRIGDDGNLVRKIRMMKEKRQLTEGYGWSGYTERYKWDDASNIGSYSGVSESDYIGKGNGDSNFPDVLQSLSGDLANVLDAEKIIRGGNSQRLRDFFKKLVETDAQIRKLKQAIDDNYLTDIKTMNDRFKRSPWKKHKHKTKTPLNEKAKTTTIQKKHDSTTKSDKKEESKTLAGNERNVTALIVEEENLEVKFEPERRSNFPKCSQTFERHHEKNLKHPFYKNSQRFDDMLAGYKKPDTKQTSDINKLLLVDKNEDAKSKINISDKKLDADYFGDKINEMFADQEANTTDLDLNGDDDDDNLDVILATTPFYDVGFSSSRLVYPNNINKLKHRQEAIKRKGQRQLMQIEEEDKEDLVYEDLKEVLSDEGQSHDDQDKAVDRNTRDDKNELELMKNSDKYSPQNIHNPNWKGPMPLYPDELNAMIKQAALQNLNEIPVNTKDTKQEKDRTEKEISDTEYIEDYSDNKYNKMVKMAQAYSDYGVLYDKKDKTGTAKEKDENNHEHKVKLTSNKDSLLNRFFGRPKKGSCGEGITIRTQGGEEPNEKEEFLNSIRKHIKIVKCPKIVKNCKAVNPMNPAHTCTDGETKHTCTPVVFTLRKGSRSLKSIENCDGKDSSEVIDPIASANNEASIKNTNVSTDDATFLSMMKDWFKNLSNRTKSGSFSGLKKSLDRNQISRYNTARIKLINRFIDNSTIRDLNYRSNDKNNSTIGHRSRVLMNFEDKSNESDSIVPIALVLAANDTQKNTRHKEDSEKRNNKTEDEIKDRNKTIVKRNVEDQKAVFWNDFYDNDEYGVKIDYLDNLRNKHSVKNAKSLVKKSKDWFRGRFSNLTRKIKARFRKKTTVTTTTTRKITSTTCSPCETTKPRSVRDTNSNGETDVKKVFADLTVNMKKVCREAAKVIQDTKNIEVRQEKKEEGAATSLMQQLVRLMSDLVDIQVQQKSCAKLPPDLYKFLEWLTIPADNRVEVDDLVPTPSYGIEDGLDRFEKSTFPSYDLTLTEDTHQDDRTECLGTIRAVQDLIQQYEGMSDEDKSKMTGVKDYLENQLEFLNRKLSGVDETNLYKLYGKRETQRSRRDLFKRKHSKNEKERKTNKHVKTFTKKRTKSTVNTYDGVTITKAKKNLIKTDKNKINNKDNSSVKDKIEGEKIDRKIDSGNN